MFREINISKQGEGTVESPKKRWYQSDYFDLFLWYVKHDDRTDAKAEREFVAMQLCYDIRRNQRALGWKKDGGFKHHRVSKDGDTLADYGASAALLVDGGEFDVLKVMQRFRTESKPLPLLLRQFVLAKFKEYGVSQGHSIQMNTMDE